MTNNSNNADDKQLILLKAYKRQTARQEKYLLFEKDYRSNKCRSILSLDDINDKNINQVDNSADINSVINKNNLHKALMTALQKLSVIERQIIDECFFYEDVKRKTYQELGKKHNISRQVYVRKLNRTLSKLRQLIEQHFDEF